MMGGGGGDGWQLWSIFWIVDCVDSLWNLGLSLNMATIAGPNAQIGPQTLHQPKAVATHTAVFFAQI